MSGSFLNPNFESGSGQDLKDELPEPRLVLVDGDVGVVDDLVGVLVQKRCQDARGTYEILQKKICSDDRIDKTELAPRINNMTEHFCTCSRYALVLFNSCILHTLLSRCMCS